MSLMGIDIGTTGCKAVVFSKSGEILSTAYEEYDFAAPQADQAELECVSVWNKIKKTIAGAATDINDPISALCAASLGESVVPVTSERKILGPSLLNFDVRGEEYLRNLRGTLKRDKLYKINGNTLGNQYGLTKLMWIKEHEPGLYESVDFFLHWSSFVSFMLGAEPAVDYSLANRSLLFDLDLRDWSEELLSWAGLDRSKLPRTVPSGTIIGTVSKKTASELNLSQNTVIVSGAHDQCSNALGCGVIEAGSAMFGLGTFPCILPVFTTRPDPGLMIERGLNTEHHALPDRFVSFIYNQTGSIVKWFRDTFAAEEHAQAKNRGEDIYTRLFSELPQDVSSVTVLPHFSAMGPPDFISGSSGIFTGLKLTTSRADILKGILEGSIFSLKECVDLLPSSGISINDYRVVGGGSKSEAWIQLCADILNRPCIRPIVTEAGALGAAIMAGAGTGVFSSFEQGIKAMVRLDKTFTPNKKQADRYEQKYRKYKQLWLHIKEWRKNDRN